MHIKQEFVFLVGEGAAQAAHDALESSRSSEEGRGELMPSLPLTLFYATAFHFFGTFV